jgi:hypothetical protein
MGKDQYLQYWKKTLTFFLTYFQNQLYYKSKQNFQTKMLMKKK